MIERKSWTEFKATGLLWWINMILHTFGWAIVWSINDKKMVEVFPARVKYRGFPEYITEEGYEKISKYMKENADALYEESKKTN